MGWDIFAQQAGFFRDRHGTQPPLESCCVAHDRSYHTGGGAGHTAAQSFTARSQVGEELRACVLSTSTGRGESLESHYRLRV